MRVPRNWFFVGGEGVAAGRRLDGPTYRKNSNGPPAGGGSDCRRSGPRRVAALPWNPVGSATPHRRRRRRAPNDNAVGDDVRGRSRRVRTDKQPPNDNNNTNAPFFFSSYRKRIPKRFLFALFLISARARAKRICARRGLFWTAYAISRLFRTRGSPSSRRRHCRCPRLLPGRNVLAYPVINSVVYQSKRRRKDVFFFYPLYVLHIYYFSDVVLSPWNFRGVIT